jgi:hypothetical protein
MSTIRVGMAADIERVQAFYAVHGSSAHILPHEQCVLIVGDGHVVPDTRSIQLMDAADYRHLSTEDALVETRTVFYHKAPRLADDVFVSQAVRVEEVPVAQPPVSDHVALILSAT